MAMTAENKLITSYCITSIISLIFWTILALINLYDIFDQKSQGLNTREGIAVYQAVAIVFYGIAALGSFVLCAFAACNPTETMRFYFISVFLALICALVDIILYLIKSKFLIAFIFLIFVIFNIILFLATCNTCTTQSMRREQARIEAQERGMIILGPGGAQISDGTGMLPKYAMNVHVDKVNDGGN